MASSTIWGQLASPNSPIGSVPFVGIDSVCIETDVLYFRYVSTTMTLEDTLCPYQLTVGGGVRLQYTDSSATPGAQVINKPSGRVAIAAGQSSIVISSTYAFLSSLIQAQLETADATLTRVIVTPAAGSFTITGNAAATAKVTLNYIITNVFSL